MTKDDRVRRATRIRTVIILVAIGGVELACRTGAIPRFTMIPPSEMATGIVSLFRAEHLAFDVAQTLLSIVIAICAALAVGFLLGALLYALPRARQILDPFFTAYYAVPVFVFYPLFIVLFGLNAIPKTVIGFLYAVVAMIVNTLNGLDRIPAVFWKTARVYQLSAIDTAVHILFPCAGPYLFTGAKLAVVYAFTGVIGSEFILSSAGVGYRISFAYNFFKNAEMYPLILFVVLIAILMNMRLYAWERALMERRGGR
jgi:NitT/TauT family transport system permease protein